ncbi:putative gluconolactonase precursor, partial [Glonium stellatum]
SVACVNKYASVMPYPFSRFNPKDGSISSLDRFSETNVSDASFELVRNATFIVFDQNRGLQILGQFPSLELMFTVPADLVHEAPVYVPPPMNAIILSALHAGVIPQLIINLNASVPTIANFTSDPPVYAVNGGRYFNGTVFWAVGGGFPFQASNGSIILQTPGIFALDPMTRKVTTLLNNYYGAQFNSPDDLAVDANGDIYFTDPWYGWGLNLTTNPILAPATWRFRPSTGSANIIETSLVQPNGVGISPDGRTLYVTDTGATVFNTPPDIIPRYTYNSTGPRLTYAFDVTTFSAGGYLTNKRPIWLAEEVADDGFHVAGNGYLVGAAGFGVDILSPYGELLIRIQTEFFVNNIQFAGADYKELWLFGQGGISRVTWNLQG